MLRPSARLEVRIGQPLGPAQANGGHGAGRYTGSIANDPVDDGLSKDERSQFRKLADHPDIAELLGLPRRTVADWIGPIVATHREVRRTQVRLLSDAGWTQAAIGKAVGLDQRRVSDALPDMADSPFPVSPDLVSAAVDRLDGDAHDAAAEVARRAQSAQALLRGKSLMDRSALCRRWLWGGPGGHPPGSPVAAGPGLAG